MNPCCRASIPILQDLGVLDEVEKAGFVRKRGATMVWGSDPEPWSWYFSETNVSNPHSYQVWRPEFDQILLDNARRNGVRVLEGQQATGITLDSTGPGRRGAPSTRRWLRGGG